MKRPIHVRSLVYDLAFWIYALFTAPFFFLRGKHKEGWSERWGNLSSETKTWLKKGPVLWVHAVSVGEARLACLLIKRIKKRAPQTRFILTTTTASGQSIARKESQGNPVLIFPFDLSFVIRRFLNSADVRGLILLETEIWPNVISTLHARGIPVMVVNGRLSDRAYKRYKRARILLKDIFAKLNLCLVQSQKHRDRFVALGVPEGRIMVTGNMKYDLDIHEANGTADEAMKRWRQWAGGMRLLGASTHPGEEDILIKVYKKLHDQKKGLRLVLAPRHIERVDEVLQRLQRQGLGYCRLSDVKHVPRFNGEVMVVDRWGVLKEIFSHVDLVFMGGSLVPHGGHNLAEPAQAGKPVMHGPHMHNFEDMAEDFQKAKGSFFVKDAMDLEACLENLMTHSERLGKVGEAARSVALKQRGATEKNVNEILLGGKPNESILV
jgi:3-deoxy-D-manno-octulosonic-acid transferase